MLLVTQTKRTGVFSPYPQRRVKSTRCLITIVVVANWRWSACSAESFAMTQVRQQVDTCMPEKNEEYCACY